VALAARVSTAGGRPRYRLDEAILAPVRLPVMAALANAERMDFRLLRDLVEVSDSLLSKQMSFLEEAGYVEVIKGYHGKRPRTRVKALRGVLQQPGPTGPRRRRGPIRVRCTGRRGS